MKISLPKNIANIITIITSSGFKAHIVGGCVRDMLINKVPSDWDITTNASPQIIKSLFPKTFDTGIKHGTITVIQDSIPVEVTTWRKETGYSDHRHPDSISLANSLSDDLSRRDFTMNAIAYHPVEGLVDPFNGVSDIAAKIIRCVGKPSERFSEDALRMLRAIRFSAQLDFDIDKSTFAAINELSGDIIHISKERIQGEMNKILEAKAPHKLSLLWDSGLSKVIFPQIQSLPSIWGDIIKNFIGSENQKEILLSLLFYLTCKTDPISCAEDYLMGNKYDSKTQHSVKSYINCLTGIGPLTPRNIRKAAFEYGTNVTRNTLKILSMIKSINDNKPVFSEHLNGDTIPVIPSISGLDLKSLGLDGKAIKDMLDTILLCLYENPDLNSKDILIQLTKKILVSKPAIR
ncbi:MAG: CCA tRNA nucleotidyltransferase [Clostridiaceae bacterium]|nr:CCA tRNA nucleotidyltransferase [Clostridiaceae bacterium]